MHADKAMWRFVVVACLVVGMTASVSADGLRGFDDFEDGDYTSSPVWDERVNGGSAQIQTGTVLSDSRSLEMTSSGDTHILTHDRGSGGGGISDGDVYQARVMLDTNNEQAIYGLSNSASASTVFNEDDGIIIRAASFGDTWDMYTRDGSGEGLDYVSDVASVSADTEYLLELTFDTANDQVTLKVKDENGNTLGTGTATYTGVSSYRYVHIEKRDGNDVHYWDDVSYSSDPPNQAPQFNSSSVSSDPPLIGESVSYSAEVYDSDGSISDLELTVYQDGSQVYQSSTSSSSNTWNDVYTADEGDIDARFVATDDAGATTTEWINRTLSETAPTSPTINSPNGQTFNDDSIEYDIATSSDGDDNEDESLTLTLEEDGTQVDQVTTTEGNSVTGSYTTSEEGSHNFDVTVEEPDGETSTASSTYSVDFISPTVDSTSVSPDPFDYQDSVDITVDASDNTEVIEVCVQVDKDGSNFVGQTCKSTSSDTVQETFTDYFTVDETNSDYTVNVDVTDNQGKTGSSSTTYTVNNDAPTSSASFDQSTWNYQDNIDVNYDFSDPNGNFDYGEIKTYKDNNLQDTYTVNDLSGTYTDALLIDETNSDYKIEVIAYDLQGATDTYTENQKVNNEYPSVSASYDPSSWTFNDQPDINYNFSDPNNNIDSRSIEVYKDSNLIESYSPTQNVGTVTDAFLVDETDATYEVQLNVTDLQGATGSSSTSQFVDNTAPVANLNATPETWFYEDSIDLSYDITDNEGDIETREIRIFEAGTRIKTILLNNNSGTLTDVFTTDLKDTEYQAQLFLEDSAGQTDSESITQTITDNAPSVSLVSPGNKTFWTYNVPLEFDVSDSDKVGSESYSCNVDTDGQLYEEFLLEEGTNSTYSDTVRSDLGTHTVEVSCTDGSGNTGTDSETYTVDNFEIDSTSANNQAYETTNQSFTADLTAGDMVNNVETSLYFDNKKTDTEKIQPNGVSQFAQILRQKTPLVTNNATSKNWKFDFNVNYTGFNGNYQTLDVNSSEKTQEILWSYYLENSFFSPDNNYIETEDLEHNAQVHTETKKAELSGITTYKRDSSTDSMELVDSNDTQSTLQGVINTGLADSFNQSSFQAESEVNVKFKGDSRSITTGNDQLQLYRIQLFDTANPGSLNTAKALEFDVNYEEEDYDTKTRLTMDLSVWKNEDEKIRRFQFKEEPAKEHSYHIYPSWAEYNIQTKPYPEQTKFDLIQFFNQDTGKVRRSYFFPKTQTIGNDTTTVPVKTINRTEASQIDFEVSQSGGEPATNTYCRVDRKFGGGDFETVFMIKTGSKGNSQSFAEVNEIYYSFTCYKNGEVIETFPSQIMQQPMILNIGQTETETQLDYSQKFDASCNYNQTQISCDYQSQSENLKQANLNVESIEPVTNMQVCNKNGSTATGTVTCNGLNTSKENYKYRIAGDYGNKIKILGDSGKTGEQTNQYGAGGIMMTLFLFIFVFAATSFNIPLGIGLGTLSILFSSVAGFLALTPAMRATLIGLAIVAGLVVKP